MGARDKKRRTDAKDVAGTWIAQRFGLAAHAPVHRQFFEISILHPLHLFYYSALGC